jgi:hypothetical protein
MEGAPFHAEGDHPQAPCPFCEREKNDSRPKLLYAIRGTSDGEHDSVVPKEWFQFPPGKLNEADLDMRAIRAGSRSPHRFILLLIFPVPIPFSASLLARNLETLCVA